QADGELALERALRMAREEEAGPPAPRAREDHGPRADAVAQRAPAQAGRAHREEVERHGARHGRRRPAGRFGDRPQEPREREHRADRDTGHEGAERHHHPSVTWLFHDASAAAFSAAMSIFFIL